jgi:hypothetical protein
MATRVDYGFRDFWQLLIVFGQAPPSSEPAECSFNDPSAGDHGKACGPGDAADDDQRQAEQKAGEQDWQPVVDLMHGCTELSQAEVNNNKCLV